MYIVIYEYIIHRPHMSDDFPTSLPSVPSSPHFEDLPAASLRSPEKFDKIGFIILRHVNSPTTDEYWQLSYKQIRTFYPDNPILIIDDNSNPAYVSVLTLYNTTIVSSEFPGRGELLPYLYYLTNPIAEKVMILHDSMFLTRHINFLGAECYQPIWHFRHHWDQIEDETRMIQLYSNPLLSRFYSEKSIWDGSFGGTSIISHKFLKYIHAEFDLYKLTDMVRTRYNRMSFERVIGCIMQFRYYKFRQLSEVAQEKKTSSLLGDIHNYCVFNSVNFSNKAKYMHLPIVKLWTGR